jgi:hypothetical protein
MINVTHYGFEVVARAPSAETPSIDLNSEAFVEQLKDLAKHLAGGGIKVGGPSIEDQITEHGPCIVEFDVSYGGYSGYTRIRFDTRDHKDRKNLIEGGLVQGLELTHDVSVDIDDNINEDRHYDHMSIDSVFHGDLVSTFKNAGFKDKFANLVKRVVKEAKQADRDADA